MKKLKVFKVGHLRKFEQQIDQGKISYTKMIEILNDMAYDSYNDSSVNFCKQYHKRENSQGKLLQTRMKILPSRDGNCMDMANELIREGWELCLMKDLSKYSEIQTETVELIFNRWIEPKKRNH